jgi:pimeloyl-ACP methyl ester carboxylesterase
MPFAEIKGLTLEYSRIAGAANMPTLVLLHEGLGSVSMWRDFPQKLAAATLCSVFTYSRLGYGASEPLPPGRNIRKPDFMHTEAWEILPELRRSQNLEHVVLFGHSDGGSIALLHAARHEVAGTIVMAPHVRVETISVKSIEAAKVAYEDTKLSTGLRARLAKYHDDVDGAFYGWNDIWLSPDFRKWNIEAELPAIKSPLMAMQGENDEYGTMYQIEEVQRRVPGTRILRIPSAGHSPHRDQPDQVLALVQSFISTLPQRNTDKAA